MKPLLASITALISLALVVSTARAEGEWEITPQSRAALAHGLEWLAQNQGPEGNWQSNDLGLVSMGALAFLADGHTPGRGKYGRNVELALNYVLSHAKPSGLLNIADAQRDMYNHGLSTFVLGQAYGMTNDQRISSVLERALKLIANTQCKDGGWDYRAGTQDHGHDLSLAVMQAKALRSAVDSGLEVSPEVIRLAIRDVREHYSSRGGAQNEADQEHEPGQFTYMKNGGQPSIAMAAAGVVCLQEFGQYDDWRIPKNMQVLTKDIKDKIKPGAQYNRDGKSAFDSYTLYYIGQAMYQVGGTSWKELYPLVRDNLIATQVRMPGDPHLDGVWHDTMRVSGQPGDLYATSVSCFILAIPNRYLPILQEGKIKQYQSEGQATK
ncbi:MAG TPA: squalene--hopene cyclase [Pirellulales bacterium]|jgi:hypothetical protein|nr:squalene--hopene cyclase [Pirellulales bacterium]